MVETGLNLFLVLVTKKELAASPVLGIAYDMACAGRIAEALLALTEVMTLTEALNELAARAPEKGDIMECSWGYDQTNIDYYEVVKTTASSVWLKKLTKKVVGGGTGYDTVAPVPGSDAGKPVKMARWSKSPYFGYAAKVSDFGTAFLWSGKPATETAAGYGH
jgi:hypothetical protein